MTENKIRTAFNKGCVEYDLLHNEDRILVGVSGGKDSLTLLKLLAERCRIYKPKIHVEAAHIIMDNIPYEINTDFIQQFCTDLGIRLHVLHTSFNATTDNRKTPCFLCSWQRRKMLFSFATEHKFNKVALGHHQDDFITTMLMNMSFEGAFAAMSASTTMAHYPITIIKPLCMVAEKDIALYAKENKWMGLKKNCPYEEETQRKKIGVMVQELMKLNPEIRFNLWKCMHNIQTDRLPQKSKKKARHHSRTTHTLSLTTISPTENVQA